MKPKRFRLGVIENWLIVFVVLILTGSCKKNEHLGVWDYQTEVSSWLNDGLMFISESEGRYTVTLRDYYRPDVVIENVSIDGQQLSANFELDEVGYQLNGSFEQGEFSGQLVDEDGEMLLAAKKQSTNKIKHDHSHIDYLLDDSALPEVEKDIDHAGMIRALDYQSMIRGARVYNSNCINCHGNPEFEGSIPTATKFWEQSFKAGADTYSMYLTVTRGMGLMPPQVNLTPQQKYDVILYIQQEFIKNHNQEHWTTTTPGYLSGLPKGSSHGPATQPYQPWSDMDYGNFFINTYELVDEQVGPARYHSPGPVPYEDENYLDNNFAYKGIAIRLDQGPGGVSKGKDWVIFDHDLMRVAGGWSGNGFIDWEGILLNDKHETYPRTIGKLHFETPVIPGWANPKTGSFEDPRFRARDGRAFGPLPNDWADYKGLYHYQDQVILSYTVGSAQILEKPGVEYIEGSPVFTRTLEVAPSGIKLKLMVAPETYKVGVSGYGGSLVTENGMQILEIDQSKPALIKLFISDGSTDLNQLINSSQLPRSLTPLTKGGDAHYPQVLTTQAVMGSSDGPFAVDDLNPPFDNPWKSRMKFSGLDFLSNPDQMVACTTDGDVWLITGLLRDDQQLQWKRIGSGLFQPLGLKVLEDKIFITCRDQIVLLHDLNGDDETDYYESFNNDHQVTDHFHEFAMGLQADVQGNLYYAKSGRHAREALIPQHGTLIKVNKDGTKSEIIASGFRAANGVCINPDGSFIVTDQQGYWNPMNRVNWITGSGKFYGNMWGYDPPDDTSRLAMEPPMLWLDMDFDRSPSELVWVDSKQWGAMDGKLLSFSYGYGKVQLVLPQKIGGVIQGGIVDLPGIKFMTGVMRGRFNPKDGQLYACGMSAWGTNQLMRGGGLYRIRYTGEPLTTPIRLKVNQSGVILSFAQEIDLSQAEKLENYKVESWELIRSSKYGSDRHNKKTLIISSAKVLSDKKSVLISIDELEPVDVMTITYDIVDSQGTSIRGTIQNTVHHMSEDLVI